MINVYTGLPSAGKNTMLSFIAFNVLRNNYKQWKKTGYKRKLCVDFTLNEKKIAPYRELVEYFNGVNEMETWRDADIFFGELALDFDAHHWESTPRSIKKYLRLHRHYRVNIWGCAQDFTTVDISFRRLVNNLYYLHRILGSREPLPTPLAVKLKRRPLRFLFTLERGVDRALWGVEKEHYEFISTTPRLFWGSDFDLFDTHEDVADKALPPLRKIVRVCPEDGYTKVTYV